MSVTLSLRGKRPVVKPERMEQLGETVSDSYDSTGYDTEYTYSEEEDAPVPAAQPAKDENVEYEEEEEKEEEKEATVFCGNDAMLPLFQDLGIPISDVEAPFAKIEVFEREFLRNVDAFGSQDQRNWYRKIQSYLTNAGISELETILYREDLEARAREVVSNHRFPFVNGGCQHRFRVAVSGPDRSGKSTMVALLTRQLVTELAVTDAYKSTFIFAVDFAQLSSSGSSCDILYNAIVRDTFEALAAQRPLLAPFVDGLRKSFYDIVKNGRSTVPKAFSLSNDFRLIVPHVQALLQLLAKCRKDPTSLEPLMTNACTLPLLLARIFGFSRVVGVIDHLEMCNYVIQNLPPFEESPKAVNVQDYIKMMLSKISFIVSCKNQRNFFMFLAQNGEEVPDLRASLMTVSTLDVVREGKYNDKEFVVTTEDKRKLTLNIGHFGGCPAFLKKWEDLNIMADDMDEEADEEQELFINALMQTTLKEIVLGDVIDSIHVTNVVRK